MRSRSATAPYLFALLSIACTACDTRHVIGEAQRQIPPCGAFAAGTDLNVCTAGYIGGSDTDFHPSVDIAADGSIILATRGTIPDVAARTILFPGRATLARIDAHQARILNSAAVGDLIADLEVDPESGAIAIVGQPFGAAVIEPDLSRVRWSAPVVGHRISMGSDGTVATLNRDTHAITVLGSRGETISTFTARTFGGDSSDLAVDGTNHQIVITGAGPGTSAIQPVLDAHGRDGSVRWRNYDWTPDLAAARQLTAATRGIRVQFGRDGQLYFLAECDGGNTSVGRNPRNIAEPASLVSHDANNTPYNTNQPLLFVSRFAATTGTQTVGQMLLARASSAESAPGVATHPTGLAANQEGLVLVVGHHGCCAPRLQERTVGTQRLVASTSDAFALMLSPDMRERPLWTTFGQGSPSRATGAALSGKQAALVAVQLSSDAATASMPQQRALQNGPGGLGTEIYLGVWPTP